MMRIRSFNCLKQLRIPLNPGFGREGGRFYGFFLADCGGLGRIAGKKVWKVGKHVVGVRKYKTK